MTGDLSNYLTEIIIPDINNPNFVEQFIDFGNAIKENFEKVVSAPYLKGDRGNSIVSFTYQDDSDPQSESSRLKDTIIDLLNETFGESDGGVESDALIYKGQVISGNSAEGIEIDKVLLFRDDAEGKIYISNPYMFIDKRRNSITPEYDNTNLIFTDKSLAITGTGTWNAEEEHYDWSLKGWKVIPALYYDEEIRQYCWLVNGEKTHIIAQGVTGAAGRSARNIRVVSGTIDAEQGRLDIEHILNAQNNVIGTSDDEALWIDIEEGDIETGDLVFALANYTTSESVFEHALFGQVYVITNEGETSYFIKYNENVDIVRMISSSSFRDDLNDIGEATNGESTQLVAGIRGLYIPEIRKAGGDPPERAHMMWSEKTRETPREPAPIGKSRLRMGLVTYDDTSSDRNRAHSITPAQAEMSIEYPSTVIKGNVEISKGTFTGSNNFVVTGGNLNVEDTITSKEVHTTRDVNVDGVVNVKHTNSNFSLDKVQSKSGPNSGTYKLSLCPSFNIAYKKDSKTVNTIVETIEYPSVCSGMVVKGAYVSSITPDTAFVEGTFEPYFGSDYSYYKYWNTNSGWMNMAKKNPPNTYPNMGSDFGYHTAPMSHYPVYDSTQYTQYRWSYATTTTDFRLYTKYLFNRYLCSIKINFDLYIYFRTPIEYNTYIDDVLVDTKKTDRWDHLEIRDLRDTQYTRQSIAYSGNTVGLTLSYSEFLRIAWLSEDNLTNDVSSEWYPEFTTTESDNQDDNTIKKNRSSNTAILELLKSRSPLINHYASGGWYDNNLKLYNGNTADIENQEEYKYFIVNYGSKDSESKAETYKYVTTGPQGPRVKTGGIYSYKYRYRSDEKKLIHSETLKSRTPYDYLTNVDKLIFQTPWIGYTKDSEPNTLYAGQQLVDENGNTSITLDVTWPNTANKFYDITSEAGKKGIYWPTPSAGDIAIDRRSNIYQSNKTLYRVNDDGKKEPINFLIQVVRVDYGNTFYADVVYKLSDVNNDWSTVSESNINHLFTLLDLSEGSITEKHISSLSDDTRNIMNIHLGRLLSDYQINNIYKVTYPAFHFVLTTNKENGVIKPVITNNTAGDNTAAPSLVWLKPLTNISSYYSDYVLAPRIYYSIFNSLILKNNQSIDLDLKGDMLQINYDELDPTNSISWTSNVKDKVEKYSIKVGDNTHTLTIYPKSSMFVNDRPVTIKDSYREHTAEKYNNMLAGNTILEIRANDDYPISYKIHDIETYSRMDTPQTTSAYIGDGDYIDFCINAGGGVRPIFNISAQDVSDASGMWIEEDVTPGTSKHPIIRLRRTDINLDKLSHIIVTNSAQSPADRTTIGMTVTKSSLNVPYGTGDYSSTPAIRFNYYTENSQGNPSLVSGSVQGNSNEETFTGIIWKDKNTWSADEYPLTVTYNRDFYYEPVTPFFDDESKANNYMKYTTIRGVNGNYENIIKFTAKSDTIPYESEIPIATALTFDKESQSKVECEFVTTPDSGVTEVWQVKVGNMNSWLTINNGGTIKWDAINGVISGSIRRRLERKDLSISLVSNLSDLYIGIYGYNSTHSRYTIREAVNPDSKNIITDISSYSIAAKTATQDTIVFPANSNYIYSITSEYDAESGWSQVDFSCPVTSYGSTDFDRYVISLRATRATEPGYIPEAPIDDPGE